MGQKVRCSCSCNRDVSTCTHLIHLAKRAARLKGQTMDWFQSKVTKKGRKRKQEEDTGNKGTCNQFGLSCVCSDIVFQILLLPAGLLLLHLPQRWTRTAPRTNILSQKQTSTTHACTIQTPSQTVKWKMAWSLTRKTKSGSGMTATTTPQTPRHRLRQYQHRRRCVVTWFKCSARSGRGV